MWILYDGLQQFHPIASISDGSMCLEGVRFFSDNIAYEDMYVYVVQQDFSNEILLINRNDVISLYSDEQGEVFNAILYLFSFYSNWYSSLSAALDCQQPLQEMIDNCHLVFGPMIAIDLSLNVIAFSSNYQLGEIHSAWDTLITNKNVPLDSINTLRKSKAFQLMCSVQHATIYDNSYLVQHTDDIFKEKYQLAAMVSYYPDNNLQAQIISYFPIEKLSYPTGTIQLLQLFESILNTLPAETYQNRTTSYSNNIIFNAFLQKELNNIDKEKIYTLNNWNDNDIFCVVVFCSEIKVEKNADNYFIRRLGSEFFDCLFFEYENNYVMIKRIKKNTDIQFFENQISKIDGVITGISYTFSDLFNVFHYFQQANDCILYGKITNRSHVIYSNCALYSLTHINPIYSQNGIHPAVRTLLNYDLNNNTNFAQTLRIFLQQERSYTRTADILHVHKNTILYRIKAILNLTPIYLDDPDEREYLLLSFRIMD